MTILNGAVAQSTSVSIPPVPPPPVSQGVAVLAGSVITPAPSPVTLDPNLYVLTRGDGRVVYHLGKMNPALPSDNNPSLAENLGPYTIAGFSPPAHWWASRWTDRTHAPVTMNKSPHSIVTANRMFPFGPPSGVTIPGPPLRAPYSLMGSSSVTIYEPTTGERQDIGLITDNSAYYMLGGDPSPMIDWALAGETCPLHYRDQTTDHPISLVTYPTTNNYDAAGYQGSPWMAKGPPNPNQGGYSTYGGAWTPQQAHHPEYNYMAYQATGDLGFLESLQYHANFMVLNNAALSTPSGAIISGEYRGVSWAFRTLFMAHIATKDLETPGPLPSYLAPSSYFKSILDNNLTYYSQSISSPYNQTFRLVFPTLTPPASFGFAPWQVDYMLQALAFGVLTGHSDWAPLYVWALKNAIDRLSGTSGYPPAWAGYYLDGSQPSWSAAFSALQTNAWGGAAPTPDQVAALSADQYNGGIPIGTPEYMQATNAVIAAAQYLDTQGICSIRPTYPNLDSCFATVNRFVQNGAGMEPRHAIVSDPTVAPTFIVPYTFVAY